MSCRYLGEKRFKMECQGKSPYLGDWRERGGGTGQCRRRGATHIIEASYRVLLGPLTFCLSEMQTLEGEQRSHDWT